MRAIYGKVFFLFSAFPLKRGVFVFINGRIVPEEKASVSVSDRAFLYGDGLFETLRLVNGNPFRWRQHWERLKHGAKFLKIRLPFSSNELHSFARLLAARNDMPDSLLRLTLSRGPGAIGYSPRRAGAPTLVMSMRPAPRIGGKIPQWRLITSAFRLVAGDPLAAFKTCNKLPQVLARGEAEASGADEALLLNTDGHVAEAAAANLFWIRGGVVFTPPLNAGILPGVTRGVVFEIAPRLKIPIRQANAGPKELPRADGVFLSLTSWGIVEARSLNGKRLNRSPITASIAATYNEILMNSCACNRPSEP